MPFITTSFTLGSLMVRRRLRRTSTILTWGSAHQRGQKIILQECKGAAALTEPQEVLSGSPSSYQVYVGNLDWSMPVAECKRMILTILMLQEQDVSIQFRKPTQRPRDADKFHAGSAILTFSTSAQAALGLQRLDEEITPRRTLRVRFADSREDKIVGTGATLKPPLTPERIQLRQERAASYARRRERVAAATDAVIAAVLLQDDESNRAMIATRHHHGIPVLQAAELDWSAAPSESVCPAIVSW